MADCPFYKEALLNYDRWLKEKEMDLRQACEKVSGTCSDLQLAF